MEQKRRNFPVLCDVKAGKEYRWCGCTESDDLPWCTGNKACCPDKSVVFTADISESACLCTCGQTQQAPFCDGSHIDLYLKEK
ncbi:CDGSH iron-sulfur domain-containing protein [Legionella dresdenensis]|uniref:CDGSH iron-sulfur domain-containing protein n=1 Tax=Legionella dresdenensis TaxID=450200 RepID=A0ABV8CCT7_9GAMM